MNRNKSIIDVVRYPILNVFDDIIHFTSTRAGGVSQGNYASLNLGKFSNDAPENIHENFSRFLNEINISKNQLHLPFQTHEDAVLKIDDEFLNQEEKKRQAKLHGVDAIITNLPKQCIGVSTADCVPILIYDPVRKVVGVAHAGWRGTCSRIARKTVNAMKEHYHSNPKDLIAVLGASISPSAYEVGDELIAHFQRESFDIEKIFFKKKEKYHLDLWTANKLILIEVGVFEKNIETSGFCTYTEYKRFFSARRLGIQSGRMVSGIMIK